MDIRTVFVAFMLCTSLPAIANFEVVTDAHEVALADLRLPQSDSGTLTFKTCDECDYQTVRVSTETLYEMNSERVELADFRSAIAKISNRQSIAVTVLHHLESDTIKAVRVAL
ncbi:MAG: hypothetical protein WD448_02410 [Woeseia sp.]